MGQVVSAVTRRNLRGRRTAADNDDPEMQLAFSNTQGSYFGSHFLMCGCKFELAKPEAYLFGENSDLDLLGSKALNFPYPLGPLGNDEIRPLNLLVNIRKESVKFSRIKKEDGSPDYDHYRLNFLMDADCKCSVQVHFNAREVYQDGQIQFLYKNKKPSCSEKFFFDLGSEIFFSEFVFDMSPWTIADLTYNGGLFFPFVIAVETEGHARKQIQSTMCTLDVANDNKSAVVLKPLRQKITCDGISYLLQEIFGIENKETYTGDPDDGGLECIICMSDLRDTVILPCRHLCICSNCADTLRYKLNNCPLCRSPFRALVRLRAHRQTRHQIYETVSLVEGLNGSGNGATGIMNDIMVIEETSRSKRSNKNRKGLHQVLTMEELSPNSGCSHDQEECIEMTFISSENGQSSCVDVPETKHFCTPSGRSTSLKELRRAGSVNQLNLEECQNNRVLKERDSSSSLLEEGESNN